jgi:hypothetical protein
MNEVDELDGARAGGSDSIRHRCCDTLFYDRFDFGKTTRLRCSLFRFVYLRERVSFDKADLEIETLTSMAFRTSSSSRELASRAGRVCKVRFWSSFRVSTGLVEYSFIRCCK